LIKSQSIISALFHSVLPKRLASADSAFLPTITAVRSLMCKSGERRCLCMQAHSGHYDKVDIVLDIVHIQRNRTGGGAAAVVITHQSVKSVITRYSVTRGVQSYSSNMLNSELVGQLLFVHNRTSGGAAATVITQLLTVRTVTGCHPVGPGLFRYGRPFWTADYRCPGRGSAG
jgi:hypothetical protein